MQTKQFYSSTMPTTSKLFFKFTLSFKNIIKKTKVTKKVTQALKLKSLEEIQAKDGQGQFYLQVELLGNIFVYCVFFNETFLLCIKKMCYITGKYLILQCRKKM